RRNRGAVAGRRRGRARDYRTIHLRGRLARIVVRGLLLLDAVAQRHRLLLDVVVGHLLRAAARRADEARPQVGVVAGGGGVDQRARGADLVAAAGLQAEVVVGGGGAGLQRRVTGAGLAAQVVVQLGDAAEAVLDADLHDAVGVARAAGAGVHGLHDAA